MNALMLVMVLGQATQTGGGAVTPPRPQWVQAGPRAWVNPVLVAEPRVAGHDLKPTLEKTGATVVVDRPTMRVWQVKDAAATRAAVPGLVPVLHDGPTTASRLKVLVGLTCQGHHVATNDLAALGRTDCVPDFWMRPATK